MDRQLALLHKFIASAPDDVAGLHSCCGEVHDWQGFFEDAARQGLHDSVLQIVIALGQDIPAPARKHALRYQAGQQLLSDQLRKALAEALAVLGDAAIPVVPLKGPVLAERIYPPSVLRPSTDLDLLVRASDIYRAAALLERLGYRGATGPSERYYREHHHHLHFQRTNGPLLELHFRAFSGFGTAIGSEALFERARPFTPKDCPPTLVLAAEDEFVYLAAHLASHLFMRLAWLYDLKLFLRHHSDLSWDRLALRARSLGLFTVLAYTAQRLSDIGATIAATDGAADVVTRWARLSSPLLSAAQRSSGDSAAAHLARILFLATLCDDSRATTWFLRHHLLRGARKLAHRHVPSLVPDEWAG